MSAPQVAIVSFLMAMAVTAVPAFADQSAGSRTELPRVQIGAGVGGASVNWNLLEDRRSVTGPSFDARIGWRLRRQMMVGVLIGWYGINDEAPRIDDITPTGINFGVSVNRVPKVAQTRTLTGYVQWTRPSGVFIRPGAGFGRHAFAFYNPYPPDAFAAEGGEWGLVFSIAAGKEWRRASRFGIAAEGFFVYSTGEDSTAARTVAGIQIVPLLRVR